MLVNSRPFKILIIDDSEEITVPLQLMFSSEGIDTLVAHDGHEGLRLLQQNPGVSLILMDFNMPGMNGAEFLKEKAKLKPKVNAPVILLTASEPQEIKLQIREPHQIIGKPFKFREVMSMVKGFMNRGHINK